MSTVNPVDYSAIMRDYERQVTSRLRQCYLAEGYIHSDGSPDDEALFDAAFALITEKVVETKDDKNDPGKSTTRDELYAALFPTAPGADGTNPDDLDDVEMAVFKKLNRDCWSLTQDGPTGKIQRRLDDQGSSLILCRSSMMRGVNRHVGAFVTNTAQFILNDNLKPELDALQKKAENVQRRVEMIAERHPELEATIQGQLESTVGRVRAALPGAAE